MDYTLDPGLYALGAPDEKSSVLVTANYKMSFDRLREALPGRNVWILVLDTKGVNVWCAAGKGSFGTDELVRRIESSRLDKIVSHREVILPQLAGPGIAAHQLRKRSGFSAVYGPIRAEDLPAFMDAGFKAAPEMRRKSFTLSERAVLIPIELVQALKWGGLILPVFFLSGGLGSKGNFWENALNHGGFAVFALLIALIAGAVATPLLLPCIPASAFAAKGFILGLLGAGIAAVFRAESAGGWAGGLEILSFFFLIPAIAAYLAMNFTGASSYTSLSGVKKEMRFAVPMEIAGAVIGLCLWLASRFLAS